MEQRWNTNESGKTTTTLGVVLDIHEQTEQANQIIRSERYLSALLDNDVFTYYLLDPESRILALNKKAREETK